MNSTSKPSTQRRHKSNSPPPKSNEEKEKTKKKSSSDDSKQRREDREEKKLDKPMFSRVFVRYPRDFSNQDLTATFSKFGIVQDVQNVTDRWSTNNSSSTSTALIKFSKASEAALASEELHGKTIRNKEDESKAQLNDSEKKNEKRENEKRENENGGKSNENEKRTTQLEVFVAPRCKDVSKRDYVPNNVVYNLMTRLFVAFDRRTSNGQLRAAFEKFGTVTRVFIICDRVSQASKGIGYVTFKKASEAAKALEEICDNFFPQFAFANKEINMNSVKQEKIEDPRDFNNNITHSNYSKQTHSSSLSRDNKRHDSKRTIRDRRDSSLELENDEEYRKHRRDNSLDRDRDRIHARNGNFSRSSNDDRHCEDNHHRRSVGRRSRSPLAAASAQKKSSLSPKRSFCVQVQSDESDHRRVIVNAHESHGYSQMMVNSRRRYLDDILNKVNDDSPVLLIKTRIEEQLVKKLFDIVPGMVDFCVLCRADTTEQKSEYLVKYEDKHQTMYSLKKLNGLEVNNKRGEYVEIEYVTNRKRIQSKESTSSACTSSPAALISSERDDPRLVIMREELMKELIKEKHQKTPTMTTNEMKPEPTVMNNNNQSMVPNTINTPMMVPPPPVPPPAPMSFPAAAAAAAAAATAAAASFMPPPLPPAPASHPLIDPEHMQQTLSFFLYSSMLSQFQNSQNNANSSNGGLLMPKAQLQAPSLLPAPVNLQPALLPPPNFPLPHGLINYSPAAVATPPQTQVDECKQNTYKRNNQPTNNNNNSNKSVEKQNQHQKKHITIQVNSRDEISKELLSVIMRQFNNLLSVHLNDDRRSGYAIFASEFDALLAIDTINNRHIANTLFTARIVDMDDLLVSRSSHHHTRGSSYEEADEDSDDDDDNDDDDDDEEKKLVIVETTTTTTPVKQKAEEKQKKKSSSSSSSSSKKKSTRRVHRLVSEPLPSPQQQKQQQQQQSKNNSNSNHMSVSQAYMNDLLSGYNITNDPSLCNNTNKRKASNEFAGGSTSSSQTTKKIQRNQN